MHAYGKLNILRVFLSTSPRARFDCSITNHVVGAISTLELNTPHDHVVER